MLMTSAGSILDLSGIGGLTWGNGTLPLPQPPVDSSGRFKLSFPVRCSPPDDPHAITAAFTYDSYMVSWVFSAVPGDLALTQIATSPAAWRADVPSESGATRSYFGSSSTGPFVAPLNFGHLDADANGFIETERNGTRRYFDTNGKLTKVEYAGGVQTYTWDGANPTIEADSTHPPSRMRVTTSSGHVTNAAIELLHRRELGDSGRS